MPRPTGPALDVAQAAAYIGWKRDTLAKKWKTRKLLAAAAVKDGRHLIFLRSGLDAYLRAHKVLTGAVSA